MWIDRNQHATIRFFFKFFAFLSLIYSKQLPQLNKKQSIELNPENKANQTKDGSSKRNKFSNIKRIIRSDNKKC